MVLYTKHSYDGTSITALCAQYFVNCAHLRKSISNVPFAEPTHIHNTTLHSIEMEQYA